jgi:hypothetical protein
MVVIPHRMQPLGKEDYIKMNWCLQKIGCKDRNWKEMV